MTRLGALFAGLAIALVAVAGCGGGQAQDPRDAAVKWLDAVEDGRYDEACDFLTPAAQGGFASNGIGLPLRRTVDSCVPAMQRAANHLPDGLEVGEEADEKDRFSCAEEGIPGEAAAIEWRIDGTLVGWQAVCESDEGWLLGSEYTDNAVPVALR